MAQSKVLFTFNKLYSKLIKDVNKISPQINVEIKKNYAVIDKSSDAYIVDFAEWTDGVLLPAGLTADVLVAKNVRISDVETAMDPRAIHAFRNQVYTLMVFSHMHTVDPDPEDDALLVKVVKILDLISSAQDDEARDEMEDIVDEDIVARLQMMLIHRPQSQGSPGGSPPDKDMFSQFGNSKICNLAKEIASEISESDLNLTGADGLAGLMKGNVLSDIIKKVSAKISDKMDNGDLKQSDLMDETMDIMKLLGAAGGTDSLGSLLKNPMLASMFKNMQNGGKQAAGLVPRSNGGTSARDRLKKKMAERKRQITKDI